jgi:pyruvate/2-oxoglutarate dehydrogenase complex dihydrolipoamide acyltransferase (E2) component
MRRCGRAYCLLLVCLLVTGVTAGGALAAPGGNGNNGKGHMGRGLALAKGHAKHAPAAPQPPQAPVKPAAPSAKNEARPAPAPKSVAAKAPPGVDRRATHLTICHRTGSGRYIVISPSVTGAMKGHLKKHDDFVFTGSCLRPTEVASPPAQPPATGEHPPHDPPSPLVAPQLGSPSGDLPFTGGRTLYLFLAGSVLIASGLALLRQKPTL